MRGLEERSYDVLGVLTTSGKPMTTEVLARILQHGSATTGDEQWTSQEQVTAELERLVSLGFVGVAWALMHRTLAQIETEAAP